MQTEGADGVWLHPVGARRHTVLPVVRGSETKMSHRMVPWRPQVSCNLPGNAFSRITVSVDDLLVVRGSAKNPPLAKKTGPLGQVQKVFQEVRELPRRQQQKIVDVIAAMLNEYKRKAS